MYLSRLVLNPRSRRSQRERADIYQLHRTVMRAFPENLPPGERVLFRLETDAQTGVLTVLVQSQGEPDWRWLDDASPGYLLPLDSPNPAVKAFDPAFDTGQEFVFRLRANPTVKRDGRRLALLRDDDQRDWLLRKGRHGGFDVLSVRINSEGMVRGHTRHDDQFTLLAVQFDGLLRVTDPVTLAATVAQGIGPAKGLGFGLLSLAPAAWLGG